MIREAIILAGGMGTRLRSVVDDRPKVMAMVRGYPFLAYLIHYLQQQGIVHFIFSVGYMHESIENFLSENYRPLSYSIALEDEPLGTGGAIKLACSYGQEKQILVCNGDSYFAVDIPKLAALHESKEALCTLSLKPMQHFDRYGTVELNSDQSIRQFREKQACESGFINGGVYALNRGRFLASPLPQKFSFENDFLRNLTGDEPPQLYGMIQDVFFIDIGIPEDYERAQGLGVFMM